MKTARFFRFSTAVAVAALLAGNAFEGNAIGLNVNVGNGVVSVSLTPGHNGYSNILYREAERLASRMRAELRLNERTYRRVLDFYLREMRVDPRGHVVMVPRDREEREMRRILNGTEFRIWKAHMNGAHIHAGGPVKRPGAGRGPAPKPGHAAPPPAHRF